MTSLEDSISLHNKIASDYDLRSKGAAILTGNESCSAVLKNNIMTSTLPKHWCFRKPCHFPYIPIVWALLIYNYLDLLRCIQGPPVLTVFHCFLNKTILKQLMRFSFSFIHFQNKLRSPLNFFLLYMSSGPTTSWVHLNHSSWNISVVSISQVMWDSWTYR